MSITPKKKNSTSMSYSPNHYSAFYKKNEKYLNAKYPTFRNRHRNQFRRFNGTKNNGALASAVTKSGKSFQA